MAQNRFCPVCCAYMLQMTTSLEMSKWRKCPSCGYCEDENGENEITKKLDAEKLTEDEKRVFIKHWRKLK